MTAAKGTRLAATPLIRLLKDDGSRRPDLSERTESKFVLAGADQIKLKQLLELRFAPVHHNEPTSVVRSLYFDSIDFAACYANINGLSSRRKLRLRWYDQLQPTPQCYLEVKWRENRVTGKERLLVESARPLEQLTFLGLTRGLESAAPERFARVLSRYFVPVLIVEYKRQHFVSYDKRIRLTLDFDLRFYDQVGRNRLNFSFPREVNELVLIECKTPVGLENQIPAALSPLRLRVGKNSKYVLGCQTLGHVPT